MRDSPGGVSPNAEGMRRGSRGPSYRETARRSQQELAQECQVRAVERSDSQRLLHSAMLQAQHLSTVVQASDRRIKELKEPLCDLRQGPAHFRQSACEARLIGKDASAIVDDTLREISRNGRTVAAAAC